MSGLYFRGKITYAQTFGPAFVNHAPLGLIPSETRYSSGLIRFAYWDSISPPRYARRPSRPPRLGMTQARCAVVLLGSIAI